MNRDATLRASDKIQYRLEEAILSREYEPGTRLPSEREFQEILGVGRGTVRAAYRSLQEKGLIKIKPGGGAFVQEISSALVGGTLSTLIRHKRVSKRHLLEFREAFESRNAAYAVERATEQQILKLRKSLAALKNSLFHHGSNAAFYQMELALHTELATITGNPLFEWLASTFQQNTASYSETFVKGLSEKDSGQIIQDWHHLLQAMDHKQVIKATMIMSNHIHRFSEMISRGFESDLG